MTNAIMASDEKAQYDECAKRLISQKIILAHILVKTVDEFKEMHPVDVIPLIIDEPYISNIFVEPGLTNISPSMQSTTIRGSNTEDTVTNEGTLRFDIIFYVRTQNGTSQFIINIELQKDEPTHYKLLNRSIFYVSRLISSQKERDFTSDNYDDINASYSIWICMNMKDNTLSHIHLTKEDLIGTISLKGNLDLLNIVVIGLGKELPEHDNTYELHRLIGALLSDKLNIAEKLEICENEYNIPIHDNMRKDVNIMCNLGQGIEDRGITIGVAKGIEIGKARGIEIGEARGIEIGKVTLVKSMYDNGISLEKIAEITKKDIAEIENILADKITLV